MNVFKRLFGSGGAPPSAQQSPASAARDKPRGMIRHALFVVSHSTDPTMPDMARALQKILPELETPQGREAKIGMLWITRPMSEVDMTAKLVDTFGDGAANNDIYLYRTIRCAFTGGESKCLVVYEK